ncbi:DUF3344 domain-containing protein [uncultured Methanoregula sp.]|uniref:DUF3344 domain-containing protein n=1 Tax=uncultured Methanoregula sp. TaxID=1005933 RepID=UPI003749C5CD
MNRFIPARTVLRPRGRYRPFPAILAGFILCIALLVVPVAAISLPLSTSQNGTVSGDLYVGAYQPVPWASQSSTPGVKEFTQSYVIPSFTGIQWARLETVVYAAGTDSRHGRTTVKLDADGDGIYETPLGTEDQQTAASGDGEVYAVNDHMDRCYSDYRIWYNVTDLVTARNPAAYVRTENLDSSTFDGRVKEMTLIVAYHDGDSDQVKYWVNTGHDYQKSGASGETTRFDTTSVSSGFTAATLKNVAISSSDASYTFNALSPARANPVSPINNFENHTWDVTSGLTPGSASTFGYTNNGGSFKTTIAALTVRSAPDLNVTSVSPNAGTGAFIFANEPNVISITVKNNGPVSAGASTISVDVAGTAYTAGVGALASGASQTVTITDTVSRTNGTVVRINATAEGGRFLASDQTVYNNGYKGKRFTDGSDMNTQASFDGHYGVLYSAGNTAYNAAGWTAKTYTWTSADLAVPAGATVASARLYQGYSYNKMSTPPAFSMSFNSNTVTPVATYLDRKSFGTYDYPYGLYVYDVTSRFSTAGNGITITPEAGNNYALYGAYLVVVYEDAGTTVKKIYINDEFDNIWSRSAYSTTNEEATAYASFAGVDTSGVTSAQAIAILSSAGDSGKSRFFFNSNEYTGFWSGYQASPQIGFSAYDVTSALASGTNTARLQSYDTAGNGDSMYAQNVILVIEKSATAPVASFTSASTSGSAPLTVSFTDTSANTPTSWSWDFGDGSSTNATVQSPVHTFASAGTYTVNLTATNSAGSNSHKITNFITVSAAPVPPVSAFSANRTTGMVPLAVLFHDDSTNDPTEWLWDFGDGSTSNIQDVEHIYTTAGTYTVNLTATNTAGSNSQKITNYITVSAAAVPPVANFTATPVIGLAPLSVTFTDSSTGSPVSWTWEYRASGTSGSWTSFNTTQNPVNSFTAGAYDIRLTVTNAAGSNPVARTQYISVSTGPARLATVRNGMVSGDLYVGAYQPVPWSSQSSTPGLKTFTQVYTIPANTGIQWARLYAVVYAAGSDNRAGRATVSFDGNGDGTYETVLGTETLATAGTSAADVYPVNDHVSRQYSDYKLTYDVTPLISVGTVNAQIATTNVNSSSFDGRLKELTLVVAYNDGDSDTVRYWVNEGHDYQTSSGSAVTSTFGTSPLVSGWTNATLKNVMLSGKDASYTINSNTITGANPVSPIGSFGNNSWDVTNYLKAGSDSSFVYTHAAGSSYKTTLATLAVKYTAATAPVAAFSANRTTGAVPLAVLFHDDSTNDPAEWLWDFGDGSTSNIQDAEHTYTTAGTYTVNLTATNAGGVNSTVRSGYITVSAAPTPTPTPTPTPSIDSKVDVTVSAGPISSSSPSPSLFAHYTANTISATVRNSGTESAGSFNVTFSIGGNVTRVTVPGLAAGASTVVSTTDTVDRPVGASVPVTVTADAENTVAESNEANNEYTYTASVIRNGYAGMRWGDGPDLITTKATTLHGDIIHSLGNSAYGSGSATWTSADLPVPAGATVKDARLYITYTWDSGNVMPGAAVTSFNGVSKSYDSFYSDKKNWGTYAYPYGVIIYNVTGQFNAAGNSVSASGIPPIRGMELVVIYEDPTATEKQIFVNEGFDILYASPAYYTTEETATAYAPFTGQTISPVSVNKATLTTFINKGGSGTTRGTMIFNGHEWPDYWVQAGPEICVNTTDVTAYLASTGNTAGFRSLVANNMDMEPHLAILKVEYKSAITGEPVASFSSNVTNGQKPLAVRFTDLSAGSPTGWKWDFGDSTNTTEQNPAHVYTSYGTYTVSLTATNAKGNNTLARSSFITVNKPSAAASFTANKTSGDAPMTVSFNDTSTGEPESWSWDFGDSQTSTGQNPVHTYSSSGTYTVKLTTANTAGSSTATITITVNVRTIADQSFAIANLTTTRTGAGQNVTIDIANATVYGNTVSMTRVGHGWDTLAITMTDVPLNDSTSLTGTVASVVAAGTPVTVPITDVGTPAINYTLSLREVPDRSAQITMTITKDPDSTAQSSFTLAATGAGKQIDAIAYSVNFNKTSLANHGDGGSILNATIGMAVSPAWVIAHGGRDHIVIIRRADDGTTRFLATQYQGTDDCGNELYTALSPDGLSTFVLSSVSTASSGSGSSGGSSGSYGGGSSGGGSQVSSSSSKEGKVYEYLAPPVTSYSWVEKTTVADKGKVEILPLTADIAAMPELQARWIADIPQKPDGGGRITSSIVQSLPGQTLSLYRSALASRGLDIGTVAYSMVVNEEGIPETRDAVIEMSVPQDWVKQNGGITQVRILRIDNDAKVEVLDTAFARYDTDSKYIVFRAKSPDGLCTFTLVSVKTGSGTARQAPVGEPVIQPPVTGNTILPEVPVAVKTNYIWIVAGIVLVVVVSTAVMIVKIRRRREGPW